MKRILIDMDGVIADVYSRFFELHKKENGITKTFEEIIGFKEAEAFPSLARWVETPGFFRDIPVMKDSRRVLDILNKNYDVVIVSMATEFPMSLTDKQLWLHEHFPFISWKQIVFCGNKSLIKADIMIDDHFKNLDNFTGETYIFTQPHNINAPDSRHKRVSSWEEIENQLIFYI